MKHSKEFCEMFASLGSEIEHTLDNGWRYRFYLHSGWAGELRDLGEFAICLHHATSWRLKGETGIANQYDKAADAAYDGLPDELKW